MTNACPVVCCTACAISKMRALIRFKISAATPARSCGLVRRHPGRAARAAAIRASGSARGYRTPSSRPYGEVSVAIVPVAPGTSIGKS